MASSFTTNLQFEKQATGEHKGTWGPRANNVFDMVEDAISGYATVAMTDTNMTLTQSGDGNYYDARNMMLEFTGTLTIDRTVTFPSVSKTFIAKNSTTGGKNLIIKVASSTYTLPNGQAKLFYTNGSTLWSSDNLVTPSSSVSRFNIVPFVDASGIIDIGSTIDFHSSNTDANDYTSRLALSGSDLFLTPFGSSARKMWNDSNLSYVEASWMPSLKFGGNSVGMTYFTQTGRSVRIGNALFWDFSLILTAKGSSTGLATVSGFPVAPATVGGGIARDYNALVGAGMVMGVVQGTSISLSFAGSTLSSLMSDANFSNASQLQMWGWYRV